LSGFIGTIVKNHGLIGLLQKSIKFGLKAVVVDVNLANPEFFAGFVVNNFGSRHTIFL
jgi:hypothetical protein